MSGTYLFSCQVISIRPYITFTNRLGQNIYMKLSSEDEPKILQASDARVSLVYRESGRPMELQVGGYVFNSTLTGSMMF